MTFTPTPPTVAGAYWFKWRQEDIFPLLLSISTTLLVWHGEELWGPLAKVNGLFSPRLVPVDEVEKAWKEGLSFASPKEEQYATLRWKLSHARKVVEGEGE
jgi:hypothetical protein